VQDPAAWAAAFEPPRAVSFSIAFGRRPKMVAMVRRIVADFYGTLYDEIVAPVEQERGWTSQVSSAAHELVENTVRHGLDGDAVFSITVDPDLDDPGRASSASRRATEPMPRSASWSCGGSTSCARPRTCSRTTWGY
jgi:hypothetical protein